MRRKIFLKFLSVLILVFIILGGFSFFFCSSIYHNEVNSKLLTILKLAERDLEQNNNYEQAFMPYKSISNVRITLINKNGVVLYDTNADSNQMENHLNRGEVQQALANGQGFAERRSATTNEAYKYAAERVGNDSVLRVAISSKIISQEIFYLLYTLLATGLILFLICAFLIYRFSKVIVTPVKSLTSYAKAEGKIQLDKTGMTDEILILANSLEDMTFKIDRHIENIKKLERVRSEFVSNVTHELKTPLTSIKGFVEMLKQGAIKDEKVAYRFLDIINIEAERLQQLINDVLVLSHIESTKTDENLSYFDFNSVIEEVITLTKQECTEKQVKLKFSSNGAVFVHANIHRMKQILINLVSNAIKYNVPDGEINISLTGEGKNVILVVSDTGVGMEEEHLERIFERFYRVDKARTRDKGSTGLGLSIVKHITERYGGAISVTSQLNKGSNFKVVLPIKEEDEQ